VELVLRRLLLFLDLHSVVGKQLAGGVVEGAERELVNIGLGAGKFGMRQLVLWVENKKRPSRSQVRAFALLLKILFRKIDLQKAISSVSMTKRHISVNEVWINKPVLLT
jgi:hypothetical protein